MSSIAYCNQIWKKRHFWYSLMKADLRRRYRRSWLGVGWSLMHPVAMTCVFCIVFTKLFGDSLEAYAAYVLSGMAFWNFFTGVANEGCQSFYQSEHYIRQQPAPLAIYPLRTTLGMAVHLMIALAMLLSLVLVTQGLGCLATLWALAPALVLLFVSAWSIAICVGVINVIFPDTAHLVQVAMQVLFYMTPIFYSPRLLTEHGMSWILDCNPLVACLDLLRDPILYARLPSAHAWAMVLAMTAVTFGLSVVMLSRVERRLIFHL